MAGTKPTTYVHYRLFNQVAQINLCDFVMSEGVRDHVLPDGLTQINLCNHRLLSNVGQCVVETDRWASAFIRLWGAMSSCGLSIFITILGSWQENCQDDSTIEVAYPSGVKSDRWYKSLRVSIAFLGGEQIVLGWDTASMLDMILPASVSAQHVWTSRKPTKVRGIGAGVTHSEGVVCVEDLQLVVGGVTRSHHFKVLTPPEGMHIMFGIPTILRMLSLVALHRGFVFVEDHKETIHVDDLNSTLFRIGLEPVGVVSLCDGLATSSVVLRELGLKFSEYRAVENSVKTRAVARGVLPTIVHVPPHDVNKIRHEVVTNKLVDGGDFKADLGLATPCCQPWSRLSYRHFG